MTRERKAEPALQAQIVERQKELAALERQATDLDILRGLTRGNLVICLRRFRTSRRMSLRDLAPLLRCSAGFLNDLEHGRRWSDGVVNAYVRWATASWAGTPGGSSPLPSNPPTLEFPMARDDMPAIDAMPSEFENRAAAQRLTAMAKRAAEVAEHWYCLPDPENIRSPWQPLSWRRMFAMAVLLEARATGVLIDPPEVSA